MPLLKKGDEVLDLTELKKRGLLKIPENKEITQASQSEPSANPLSFLDTLAASAAQTPPTQPAETNSLDLQDVKVKLEDFEYKLDRFTEKLAVLETKLEEFENRFH